MALVVTAAIMANLAVQSSVASLLGTLATLGAVGVVLLTSSKSDRNQYLTLGLVGLLATNLFLRTSPWVAAPTILAIGAFLLLAAQSHLPRAQSFVLVKAGIRWFENLFASIPWLVSPIVESSRKDELQVQSLVRGLATAAVIGTLLVALLAAADSVFASLFGDFFDGGFLTHVLLIGVLAIPLASLGASASSDKPMVDLEFGVRRFGIEGFMGLVTINAVLGLWCATQLFVALGHADRILETEGLTRAEYARKGFFELVVVAVIVVLLLSALDRITERTSTRSKQIFIGLGVFGALETIVLVGITYSKLDFYMDAFGLTMLRLSVACFLGWLAVVLLFVAARLAGLGGDRGWTATASLVLAALATVGFGWVNPEARVASYNLTSHISDTTGTVDLDTRYLTDLSADAQPTVIAHLGQLDQSRVQEITRQLCAQALRETKYLFDWNLSHSLAGDAREQLNC